MRPGFGFRPRHLSWSVLAALLMVLAACGSGSAGRATDTPSPTETPTSAPTATATSVLVSATPRPNGSYVCPTTTSGATTTYNDSQFALRFSYPATWTEHDCQQLSDTTILIGNLFFVNKYPRNGQTIAQWVDATKASGETVTLAPLTVPGAVEGAQVSDTLSGNTSPRDARFLQSMAIVAGSHDFYVVRDILAQMSMTDTNPLLSKAQLAEQVVTTFAVP